jgi:hypothetical protein
VQPFEVKPERVDTAVRIFSEKWAQLTDERRLMVFAELNLYHCVSYDEDGNLQCQATDLQIVAIAAAFAAVADAGGWVDLTKETFVGRTAE